MKKNLILALALIFGITLNCFSQNSTIRFGLKAGANYSKFTPNLKVDGTDFVKYQRKTGFYAGGFLQLGIADKLNFQPELIFAVQGTGVLIQDIQLTDKNGERTVSDYESNINESTLAIPLVIRYNFTEDFFLDGGPQIGYIFDRNENIKKDPFAEFGNPSQLMEYDYDKFDLGLTFGTGYNLSQTFTLNGRFFFGLFERDNAVKSSVFNLGLEYNL
jgi:hypothetical protein